MDEASIRAGWVARGLAPGEARTVRRLTVCLLVCSDAAAAAAGLALAAALWAPTGVIDGAGNWLRRETPALLLLAVGACAIAGLHRTSNRNPYDRFRMRSRAALIYVCAAALLLLRSDLPGALAVVPTSGVLALVLGLWGELWLAEILDRRGIWRVRVAVYGDDERARACAGSLKAHPEWGMDPVAFLAAGSRGGVLVASEGDRIAGEVDALIVPEGCPPPRDLDSLRRVGIESVLLWVPSAELPTFAAQIRPLDGAVAVEFGRGPRGAERAKRAADLLLAVPLAILAAPVVALLAIAIKAVDPGPALYRQKRVGCGGREISIVKLRTMYCDAERRLADVLAADPAAKAEWGTRFKLSADPRILPGLGAFLRRSSLDELPQIWNVIRGDISLVGPRPFPQYHVDAFPTDFRALRSSVPQGLTGIWQISCRSDGDIAVQRSRDAFYIRHRSMWLDAYVILATVPAVLRGRGAR